MIASVATNEEEADGGPAAFSMENMGLIYVRRSELRNMLHLHKFCQLHPLAAEYIGDGGSVIRNCFVRGKIGEQYHLLQVTDAHPPKAAPDPNACAVLSWEVELEGLVQGRMRAEVQEVSDGSPGAYEVAELMLRHVDERCTSLSRREMARVYGLRQVARHWMEWVQEGREGVSLESALDKVRTLAEKQPELAPWPEAWQGVAPLDRCIQQQVLDKLNSFRSRRRSASAPAGAAARDAGAAAAVGDVGELPPAPAAGPPPAVGDVGEPLPAGGAAIASGAVSHILLLHRLGRFILAARRPARGGGGGGGGGGAEGRKQQPPAPAAAGGGAAGGAAAAPGGAGAGGGGGNGAGPGTAADQGGAGPDTSDQGRRRQQQQQQQSRASSPAGAAAGPAARDSGAGDGRGGGEGGPEQSKQKRRRGGGDDDGGGCGGGVGVGGGMSDAKRSRRSPPAQQQHRAKEPAPSAATGLPPLPPHAAARSESHATATVPGAASGSRWIPQGIVGERGGASSGSDSADHLEWQGRMVCCLARLRARVDVTCTFRTHAKHSGCDWRRWVRDNSKWLPEGAPERHLPDSGPLCFTSFTKGLSKLRSSMLSGGAGCMGWWTGSTATVLPAPGHEIAWEALAFGRITLFGHFAVPVPPSTSSSSTGAPSSKYWFRVVLTTKHIAADLTGLPHQGLCSSSNPRNEMVLLVLGMGEKQLKWRGTMDLSPLVTGWGSGAAAEAEAGGGAAVQLPKAIRTADLSNLPVKGSVYGGGKAGDRFQQWAEEVGWRCGEGTVEEILPHKLIDLRLQTGAKRQLPELMGGDYTGGCMLLQLNQQSEQQLYREEVKATRDAWLATCSMTSDVMLVAEVPLPVGRFCNMNEPRLHLPNPMPLLLRVLIVPPAVLPHEVLMAVIPEARQEVVRRAARKAAEGSRIDFLVALLCVEHYGGDRGVARPGNAG